MLDLNLWPHNVTRVWVHAFIEIKMVATVHKVERRKMNDQVQ